MEPRWSGGPNREPTVKSLGLEKISQEMDEFILSMADSAEIVSLKDQLELHNNLLYERARASLIISELLKRSVKRQLALHHAPAQSPTENSVISGNIADSKEEEKSEILRLREQVQKLSLENERLRAKEQETNSRVRAPSTHVRFANDAIPERARNTAMSFALTKTDKMALKKIASLAKSDVDREDIIRETEEIVRNRRLTLHNIRQNRKIESLDTLNSLKTLLHKVSQLETELSNVEMSGQYFKATDLAAFQNRLLAGFRTTQHKVEVLLQNSYELSVVKKKSDLSITDITRGLSSLADALQLLRQETERGVSSATPSTPVSQPAELPKTIIKSEAGAGTRSANSLLLDQIKNASIAKLRKVSEQPASSPGPKKAIVKIHEIQDSLKYAIANHRNAMMIQELEDDSLDDDSSSDFIDW